MLSVLLVDDRPAVLNGLRTMLPWNEIDAHVIGEARNGQEALQIALDHHPDIVITDVRMPVMDGLELCKRIHERFPDTLKMILSAYDDFTYAQQAIQYGVKDYILKPIDYNKLEAMARVIREAGDRKRSWEALYKHQGSEWKETLATLLRGAEETAVYSFFEEAFGQISLIPWQTLKDWALKTYALLLEAAKEIGASNEAGPVQSTHWDRLLRTDDPKQLESVLCDAALSFIRTFNKAKETRPQSIVVQTKSFVEKHFTDPDITVASIAEYLQLTPNYLSSVFQQMTEQSIVSYITTLRINQAKQDLTVPELTIQEIAVRIGYLDAHYFTKVFKKCTGLTPSEFRKIHSRNTGL